MDQQNQQISVNPAHVIARLKQRIADVSEEAAQYAALCEQLAGEVQRLTEAHKAGPEDTEPVGAEVTVPRSVLAAAQR